MSGIDKLKAHLDSDCSAQCLEIEKKAEETAAAILTEAREQGEIRFNEVVDEAKRKGAEIIRLAKSSAEMRERQAKLSYKVEMLNSVLGDSLKSLESMKGEEYFSTLSRLIIANAQPGEGKLLLSEEDGKSLPKGYTESINKAISGTLTLETTGEMKKKGAILVYGDIEINLTFEALMLSYEDDLKALAGDILFK